MGWLSFLCYLRRVEEKSMSVRKKWAWNTPDYLKRMIKKREASPGKAHTLDPFLADLCSKSYLEWNSTEFCFQAELEEQKWVYIRHPLLGRKAMTNLDRAFKSRNITLLTKVSIVEAMVFPVLYGWESWTIKKAECQRIDAFELWCWTRLLRVLRTARRSNQSILKEINSEYSLEGLMLKLQYFGHLIGRPNLLEKEPDAGKDWRQEEKRVTEDEVVGWHHWLNGYEFEQAPGVGDGQGGLVCCSPWGCKESETTELLNNSTSIPSWVYVTFFLPTHPSIDAWLVSAFWLLWIMLLWTLSEFML